MSTTTTHSCSCSGKLTYICIDAQFVSESSLALVHYVSGYVTKTEKSSMQEIWDQVSESKSVYNRLWSFKSDTVKWVDVSMPHKGKRRLARSDPDTDDIYIESAGNSLSSET